MKEYLITVYLNKARVVIGNKEYIGLKKLYNKEIADLSRDELFIGVLCFSHYNLDKESIIELANCFNYPIEHEEIDLILGQIIRG